MKISCQSCQAKYTIADEKVVGKIVKIRCKKCGATIVINGNDEAAAGGSQADNEPWTVNVADGDQRTMTAAEMAVEYRTGVVHDDTFCWKDGMADWLPIREIESLHAAMTGGAPVEDATVAGGAMVPFDASGESTLASGATGGGAGGAGGAYAGGGAASLGMTAAMPTAGPAAFESPSPSFPGGNGGYGNGAYAGSPSDGGLAAAPSPLAPAAARRGGGRGAGADLFGGVEQAGGEDDVMTSAPVSGRLAANEGEQKLTGQRNENSVLFSLNSLTESSGSAAPVEKTTTASGDASGLIDIKALSASIGGGTNSGGAGRKDKAVDDIMNLGGGGAFSPALAPALLSAPTADLAPPDLSMPTEEKRGGGKGLLIAIVLGCAFLGIAILGATYMLIQKPQPVTGTTAGESGSATAMVTATAPTAAETAPSTNDTAAPPANTGAVAKAPQVGVAPKAPSGGGGAVARGGGGDSPSTEAPPPPPKPAAPAAPVNLGAAMNAAAGGVSGGGAAAPAGGSSAPFDRGAAAASLGAIAGSLANCKKGDGPSGSGHVSVTFQSNGTVSTAEVDPPFQGTASGGCIAGKFRGAHVPAFAGAAVKVGKSFSL